MNYEEKYNQALERAKKVHDGELTISQDEVNNFNVYEYIFPELRESEDERIRKEIISYIKSSAAVTNKDCLAWLEKQGGKSVCKVKIGETYKCIASPRYTCFRKGDIYHVEDNFVAELINTCSDCFVLLEKQGEQKSAWSKEDEYQINTILHELDLKRELYRKEGNQVEEKRYKTQYDWLKSLKQNHWKPSEEQMKALNTAVAVFRGLQGTYPIKDIESLYNDLKTF